MRTVLFGSIGTLIDTSELQRRSFNDAFKEQGLELHWDREYYQSLLKTSGGRDRVFDAIGDPDGGDVADEIYARKSEIFLDLLQTEKPPLRTIAQEVLDDASQYDLQLGLVSTTQRHVVDAIIKTGGLEGRFEVVTSGMDAAHPKPNRAIYDYALDVIGLNPDQAIAIEDNVAGAQSARAAGLTCLGLANANTKEHPIPADDDASKWRSYVYEAEKLSA